MTINQRIGFKKKNGSKSNLRKFADKKTAYNEVCLYLIAILLQMRSVVLARELYVEGVKCP